MPIEPLRQNSTSWPSRLSQSRGGFCIVIADNERCEKGLVEAMLTLLSLGALTTAQPAQRIPVFVTTQAAAGGFTDPSKERSDSQKELVKKMKNSNQLTNVTDEGQAVIVIRVLGLQEKRTFEPWTGAQNKLSLTVRMTVGDFSAEFTGDTLRGVKFGGYGEAAERVVKQLDVWVVENRDKLASLVAR